MSLHSFISPVSLSNTAICCQAGWKSHPTIIMKASPDPVGLGPQPQTILDRWSLRSYLISFEVFTEGWVKEFPDEGTKSSLFHTASLVPGLEVTNQAEIPYHIREMLPNFQPMPVGRSPRPFSDPDWI